MSDEKILPKKSTPRTENLATLRLRAVPYSRGQTHANGGSGSSVRRNK